MRIALSWLNDFIKLDLPAEEIKSTLVSLGLEVEGMETIESIKGGLKNYVVGEVVECKRHPNADKLSVTKVNVGTDSLLDIVCGAPNVAAGQKVIVAMENAVVYNGDQSFTIKKTKLRGEPSEGMICAEDELGIGSGHDGILVLDASAQPGTPAADYFGVTTDTIFEIGLTPNRIDAASHMGVARDLAAKLNLTLNLPKIDAFEVTNNTKPVQVIVEDPLACPRYTGLTIQGLNVAESPTWLKNRLLSIGLKPINNVVDATNYVLHELGQPLHAFDLDAIKGNTVLVKCLEEGTLFITLDGNERKLKASDLMICNAEEGMCIAGVFGGLHSGVTDKTTGIFLESAYFNPTYIRKTSRSHALFTDASYRFERGTDPNMPLYALKRAALLIIELAGGTISMKPVDIYPTPIQNNEIKVTFDYINRLIGKSIEPSLIKRFLKGLQIEILQETETSLILSVPPYRVDVKSPADIVEEILRLYGFNNVDVDSHMSLSVNTSPKPDMQKLRERISEHLASNGFNEILCNSLTKASYYEYAPGLQSKLVKLENALSADLSVMRASLLFGMLESMARNVKFKNADLRFFELGFTYHDQQEGKSKTVSTITEKQLLSLGITGNYTGEHWQTKPVKNDFYTLKAYINSVFERFGYSTKNLTLEESVNELYDKAYCYKNKSGILITFGIVKIELTNLFDIDVPVYYGEFDFDLLVNQSSKHIPRYVELPKYPEVRRDLALLIDKKVTYKEIESVAYTTEKELLRNVNLFDVFESEKLGKDKKSYAVSFILRDDKATLTDERVDKTMNKLMERFKTQLNAEIR